MPAQVDPHDTPPTESELPVPPPLHGPPPPPITIPNGRPNPFFAAHRQRLADLRADLVESINCGGRNVLAAEKEWNAIPRQLRLFVLVFCGIEEPDDVLERAWRELPPTERAAIAACLRELRDRLRPIVALTL